MRDQKRAPNPCPRNLIYLPLYVGAVRELPKHFLPPVLLSKRQRTQMTKLRSLLAAPVAFSIVLFGCGSKEDFDGGKAKGILESAPINLEGEQVTLTPMQVDCGAQEDLWERPTQFSPERSTARLDQKGRDLKFNDDVVIEPNRLPYVQVRGAVSLQVDDVSNIRDGDETGTKLVDVKAGVKIQHTCFAMPLPIMGVKKGNFQPDTPASFLFRLRDDGWHVDKLVH